MQVAQFHDLNHKVAVVTGAGGGIGRATVKALSANGVRVIATDLNGTTLAASFAEAGIEIECHSLDVADIDAVRALATLVHGRHGAIDIWVNNAGMLVRGPALELDLPAWRRTLDVNLTGTFFGAQAAARFMAANGGGAIVNLSSYAGIKARPNCPDYAAAKAAVAHLTQCLALEWSPAGIRINAIAPGYIETPMSSWMHADPDAYQIYLERIPARRMGRPEEVAAAVLYLASEASSYVMGHVLVVDGGINHA